MTIEKFTDGDKEFIRSEISDIVERGINEVTHNQKVAQGTLKMTERIKEDDATVRPDERFVMNYSERLRELEKRSEIISSYKWPSNPEYPVAGSFVEVMESFRGDVEKPKMYFISPIPSTVVVDIKGEKIQTLGYKSALAQQFMDPENDGEYMISEGKKVIKEGEIVGVK